MADCCNNKACEIEALRNRQSSTLKIVLGINAAMFIVELTAGLISGSVSLVADSLDMLGDALVYGFSIYVVARGVRMKARAALFKGGIMAAFGFLFLGRPFTRSFSRRFRYSRLSEPLACWRLSPIACVLFCSGGIEPTTSI